MVEGVPESMRAPVGIVDVLRALWVPGLAVAIGFTGLLTTVAAEIVMLTLVPVTYGVTALVWSAALYAGPMAVVLFGPQDALERRAAGGEFSALAVPFVVVAFAMHLAAFAWTWRPRRDLVQEAAGELVPAVLALDALPHVALAIVTVPWLVRHARDRPG